MWCKEMKGEKAIKENGEETEEEQDTERGW